MPNDFFRVRLVCVLLDTVGMCFDRGTQKRKLDNFLVFFQVKVPRHLICDDAYTMILQYYVLCKEYLPMDVDFMLSDSIEVGGSALDDTLDLNSLAGYSAQDDDV